MTRGPKKHTKRVATPKSWMLSKMGGKWATKTSPGPHKSRESLPLAVILKNKLKYALTGSEVRTILNDREGAVRVDGKTRRDLGFPAGIMDVVSLDKSGENFRVLYDVKGRFVLKSITAEEAKYKLVKIKSRSTGPNKVPYVVTHDGRTFRYPHPDLKANDVAKLDLVNNTLGDRVPFEVGALAYITSGNNVGRIGTVSLVDRHDGSFHIVHVKDARGRTFSTRIGNVFVIGSGKKPLVSMPKDNGIYLSAVEAF